MTGVGLYIEESLQEIISRYHAAVGAELGFADPALRLAAPILLRDLARAMRLAPRPPDPWQRAALLVLSQPEGGIRGLLREFALLRRALWETITARKHPVPPADRLQVDRYLDEAMAFAAERWADFAQYRVPHRRASPPAIAPRRTEPPPLPRTGAPARPPPLPPKGRATH